MFLLYYSVERKRNKKPKTTKRPSRDRGNSKIRRAQTSEEPVPKVAVYKPTSLEPKPLTPEMERLNRLELSLGQKIEKVAQNCEILDKISKFPQNA